MLRHLELLPRPLGQDWSQIWLQRFSGTVTIWPRSTLSDFWNILADPSPERLARMLHVGQQSTFPKIAFIRNRMRLETVIMEGLLRTSPSGSRDLSPLLSRRVDVDDHRNNRLGKTEDDTDEKKSRPRETPRSLARRGSRSSVIEEMRRQSAVFFDDPDIEDSMV